MGQKPRAAAGRTMMMKTLAFVIAAAGGLAAMPAAHGQIGRSDAPIEITSERSEYLQKEGRGVYIGNVKAVQANSVVTTDKLTAVCSRAESGDCEEIRTMIAEGNVLYVAPEVKIRGDRAEYDYASDTITITGNVISSRGDEGVIRGTKIVYSVGEGRVVITATGDRVTSIINTTKKQPGVQPAQPAPSRPN